MRPKKKQEKKAKLGYCPKESEGVKRRSVKTRMYHKAHDFGFGAETPPGGYRRSRRCRPVAAPDAMTFAIEPLMTCLSTGLCGRIVARRIRDTCWTSCVTGSDGMRIGVSCSMGTGGWRRPGFFLSFDWSPSRSDSCLMSRNPCVRGATE